MKKLIGCLFGLFLVSCLAGSSKAANPVVSPKASANITYSTTVSTITAGPSALYEVTLSTGAAGEFVAFFDTVTTGGTNVTALAASSIFNPKIRILYGSTTTNTQYRFDPPLLFYYGIQAVDSASSGQALITYEEGRGLSGQ